ncbi:MAG: UDP-3-O-acyl-N-acetylglucosamine deacetylase [Pirellulales bacterium]|nr:UDP-3-O-acyl-N-acetylglucosamine deacetylase [Pirellulales bacterium]
MRIDDLDSSTRSQRTIARTASVTGCGYWSGRDVRVVFRSAPVDAGVTFVRADLVSCPRIPAVVERRIDAPRRTVLAGDGATVEMVEHILAALAGLRIDNCEVWVDAAEMPGCDGSSLQFVEALLEAGVVAQSAPCRVLHVRETVRLGDDECWIEARPALRPGLTLQYRLDYGPASVIGRQTLSVAVTPESFQKELCSSRTFLLRSEAEWLRSQGLAGHARYSDLLVFGDDGPIGNTLRYPDECVRHKLLDLVGDLALAGGPINGHVVAYRSGHHLNAELVRTLIAEQASRGQGRLQIA